MCPLIGESLYGKCPQRIVGVEDIGRYPLPYIETAVYHHRITCGIRLVCQCEIYMAIFMKLPAETCPMKDQGGVRKPPCIMAAHRCTACGCERNQNIFTYSVIIDQCGCCNIVYHNHHCCLLGEIGAIGSFQCHIHRIGCCGIRKMVGENVN